MSQDRGNKTATTSRRDVLQVAGAIGTAGAAGLSGCLGGVTGSGGEPTSTKLELGNYPVEGDTVTFGFNVPRSGPYSSEGEEELRAYKLAVEHLNNGGGWVDDVSELTGNGVLEKQVDFVVDDTATSADQAKETARRMIRQDDVIMFSGGSSSATAIAQQEVAQEEKVIFMCCLTHSNDTTGKDCTRYGFREMFNAYMTGQALAPVVTNEYGSDLSFYQLYADYTWGQTQQSSMQKFFGDAGWSEMKSVATPLGTKDYTSFLQDAYDSGAEALFLNHYGLDGANSVTQAVEMGLNEDLELIVPLYNRPMAQAAGDAIDGIFGTVAWDAQIDNKPSQRFTESFKAAYGGRLPSGPAQLAYAQTIQYAAAVERAETFYPPDVIRELEGYEYSGFGMGTEMLRACDHQAQRAVPVVQGLPGDQQKQGVFYDIVEVTPRENVGYECGSGPASACSLGPYGDE